MTNLLLVLSKNPYTTEIPNLVLDIGLNAKVKGNNVSIYLVEDELPLQGKVNSEINFRMLKRKASIFLQTTRLCNQED